MESRSRRRSRRSRWAPALLLAVVALTTLAVAGPAVARPGHLSHASGAALSASGTIAVIVVAACAALALVLLASLSGRHTSGGARGDRQAQGRPAGRRPPHRRLRSPRRPTKGVTMRAHTSFNRRKESATVAVLLALTTAILLGLCTPAVALRPRTTPAHAALLAATTDRPATDAAAVARHDAAISRMVARHDAAGSGGPAVSIAARDRRHPPSGSSPRRELALAVSPGRLRQELRGRPHRRAPVPLELVVIGRLASARRGVVWRR